MLKSPKDRFLFAGGWNLWTTGKHLLFFSCPYCSEVFILLLPVRDDGKVEGTVECTKADCQWKDEVILEGWEPLPEEPEEPETS